MKKIGIIDYFIDEWHSNEYLGLFKKANEELGLDYQITYGYAEREMDGRLSTDEWCEKKGVIRCMSMEEVCEKSDCLLILAPANPETHLKYAKIALRYGKPTYIDKTFAPDLATAKEIYAVADQYNTKIFSTSALRYAKELTDIENLESAVFTGGGRSLEEYVIHQIEMAVKTAKAKAENVWVFNGVNQTTAVIDFSGKNVTLEYAVNNGFSVNVKMQGKGCEFRNMSDPGYFYSLVKDILKFFETETPPFDRNQTLTVIAVRDAIMQGVEKAKGTKIPVAEI